MGRGAADGQETKDPCPAKIGRSGHFDLPRTTQICEESLVSPKDASGELLGSVMEGPVVSCSAQARGHLPVVDEGDLVGFVSMRDFAGRLVN